MKAIVQNAYGSSGVLKLAEVETPQINENEVLVRVHAAGANAGDYFSMAGSPWLARLSVGFPTPRNYIPGWDFAGEVEQVGKEVGGIQPGDEVYGSCSHTFAEYVSTAAENFAPKPANLTFEQAAAVPTAALTALQGLRDHGKLQKGHKVLINGAAGGVGTFAVQIARHMGAEVTGVCSTRNLELVRSLGAHHVVDYTKEDFTTGGPRYDLILDNAASRSFADLKRALTPQGLIVPNSGHGGMGFVIKALLQSIVSRQVASLWVASINRKDLVILKEWLETGAISPVIDRTVPFGEAPQAIEYIGQGHARGKVVIQVTQDGREGS